MNANFTGLKDGTDIDSSAITTAKIANDAVTAAKIDWASTGANGGIWWEELGRTTLSVAGDTISVTGIPAREYLLIIANTFATGGTINNFLRFNNDSGNNYATRFSDDGAADATSTSSSQPSIMASTASTMGYATLTVLNEATREKLVSVTSTRNTAGAATAPGVRREGWIKWANTTDQINRVDVLNIGGTGDFAIGSEVVVLGHN